HGGNDEGQRADEYRDRIVDFLDDRYWIHDCLAEYAERSGGNDDGYDREHQEVHRQAGEVPEPHLALALGEAGEIAEVEQQCSEIGNDQYHGIGHGTERLEGTEWLYSA